MWSIAQKQPRKTNDHCELEFSVWCGSNNITKRVKFDITFGWKAEN